MSDRDDIVGLTAPEVGRLVGKTGQTVKNWADTFAKYLSPLATQKNRTRIFNSEDIGVLKLVAQMMDVGSSVESIMASLENGQRGEVEDLGEVTRALQVSDFEQKRLELELALTRRELARREDELEDMRGLVEQGKQDAEEVIRLRERLRTLEGDMEKTQGRFDQQVAQIAQIYLSTLQQREREVQGLTHQIIDQREALGRASASTEHLTRTEEDYRVYYQYTEQRIRELESALAERNTEMAVLKMRLEQLLAGNE